MAENQKNINPHYQRKTSRHYSLEECKSGIQTDRQILSYLISKSESAREDDIQFIQSFLASTNGNEAVQRIAISGSPGVGKSTFVNCFGKYLIDLGHKIAVLPVDPTSEISRGSILGDKTRMDDLVGKAAAYVKPMASALALGGVAPASMVAQLLCERAGFDYIITETVGVGQSEYEARHLVDCFILLLQPGGGDELQGIKRGIMEMADILLINKADGETILEARKSLKEYKGALQLMLPNEYGWKGKVLLYSAITGEYNVQLQEQIQVYFKYMAVDNLAQLRQNQLDRFIKNEVDSILLILAKKKEGIRKARKELEQSLLAKDTDPVSALLRFKEKCKNEIR